MRMRCFALLLTLAPAFAAPVVIDFEDFALGGGAFLDVGSPLVFNNVGGSGVNVTMTQGIDFRVYDLGQFSGNPALNGEQALIDMSWSSFTNPSGTTITFSADVFGFSLDAGDFGSDDDSPLMIKLYDAGDSLLDTVSLNWSAAANVPPYAHLASGATGVRKVVFTSGGNFTGSTFFDNVSFSAVPEPTTWLALAGGLAMLARRRTKRS